MNTYLPILVGLIIVGWLFYYFGIRNWGEKDSKNIDPKKDFPEEYDNEKYN